MKKKILTLLLILLVPAAYAQEKLILFTNINKAQGLSHNHVQVILKDRRGFIWIGTTEGLCRFDGYSFKVYKNDPHDKTTLRDNRINNLFEDYNGDIWIANGDYFDIFNPVTESFTHSQSLFNNRIRVPVNSKWFHTYDIDHNIIYANDSTGLYKYIEQKDSVVKIELPYNKSEVLITDMHTDMSGNIWIAGSNAVIYKIDNYSLSITDSIILIRKPDNNYRFYLDADNDIWIFDKNNMSGAILYNSTNKELKYFNENTRECRLNTNAVTGFLQDEEKNIWVGTDHGGINIINKTDFSVKYIINNPFNDRSLCANTITTMYKDYQGFVWIGSFKKGISYYHKNLFNFSLYKIKIEENKLSGYNDINNFAEDKKGNLWIGTNGGGLIYYDRKNNSYKQYTTHPANPGSISANIIVGLYSDKKDKLWVGTYYGGLNLFDGKRFHHYKNIPADVSSISDDRIWDICEDRNGKLWIATLLGGVNIFDPTTGKVIEHLTWTGDSSLRSKVVFSIIEDRDGIIWMATVDGIRSYNPLTRKFEYFVHDGKPENLSNDRVLDIFEDSRGLIWAATSDGLNMFNKATRTFKVFRQEDGLASNNILTIIEDDCQNLWMSTSNGISNLIISKDAVNKSLSFNFRNYDVLDGLQGDEFNEKASFKTSKGEIIFGGPYGFNIFNPKYIGAKNIETQTLITDFQIFNKSMNRETALNGRYILDKSITYTKEIKLRYIENVFTIEFSNLNFFHPERRKYKYILENFNTTWFVTDGYNRKVTYTNLNPGKYTFRVIASNSDGSWSNSEARLDIIIKPPLWNTLGFKVLAGLLIILLSISLYYYRGFKLRSQKKLLEKNIQERTKQLSEANVLLEERQEEITIQKAQLEQHHNNLEKLVNERTIELEKAINKAKESERLKTAFLSNMSHEIRTPMNAIVGFAALLKNQEDVHEESREFINIINQNCESLLILINDIIDISKIEANELNIIHSKFSVTGILEELENYFRFNNSKGLEINFIKNNMYKNLTLNNDPFRFRQVVSNLISNAVKFTDQGFIKFGYEILSDKARFFVKDSGIGINEKDFIKIFDHFHKIEDNGEKFFRGAGLGLSICKKLVNLMGGDIWLESEYGKGSTFYFTLPYLSASTSLKEKTPEVKTGEKDFSNLHIIVAEDEPINYLLIEKILAPTKAELKWAKNGREAVEDFKEVENRRNTIILMDIRMPVMNGIDALKHIREIDRSVPVIALTAYAYETDRFEILRHEFEGYLTKPIKPEALVEIIQKFKKD